MKKDPVKQQEIPNKDYLTGYKWRQPRESNGLDGRIALVSFNGQDIMLNLIGDRIEFLSPKYYHDVYDGFESPDHELCDIITTWADGDYYKSFSLRDFLSGCSDAQ